MQSFQSRLCRNGLEDQQDVEAESSLRISRKMMQSQIAAQPACWQAQARRCGSHSDKHQLRIPATNQVRLSLQLLLKLTTPHCTPENTYASQYISGAICSSGLVVLSDCSSPVTGSVCPCSVVRPCMHQMLQSLKLRLSLNISCVVRRQ